MDINSLLTVFAALSSNGANILAKDGVHVEDKQ